MSSRNARNSSLPRVLTAILFVAAFSTAQIQYPRMISGNLLRADDGEMQILSSAVDRQGRLYVAGTIGADAKPVPTATFRRSGAGSDVFVARYNEAGTVLEYLAVVGGSDEDFPTKIAVDNTFRAVIVGSTKSVDFPGVSDTFPGGPRGDEDGFVLTLNAAGNQILGAARFGGTSSDRPAAVAFDNAGSVLVAGVTYSSDFPTTDAAYDQSFNGQCDGFVLKLNLGATILAWSTYLGGPTADEINGIVVDTFGAPVVAGSTGFQLAPVSGGPQLPVTVNSFGSSYAGSGLSDAFVIKLNTGGSNVLFGGYLGGSSSESVASLLQDDAGDLLVVGLTHSVNNRSNPWIGTQFPRVPAPSEEELARWFFRGATFVSTISADGTALLSSAIPDLGSTWPVDATLGTEGRVWIAGGRSDYNGKPLPGDLVANEDALSNLNASFVAGVSRTSSSVLHGSRLTSMGTVRSVSSAPSGDVLVGAQVFSNEVALGPATASPAETELMNGLYGHLVTLRFDNITPCVTTMSGIPSEIPPEGRAGEITVSSQPGCPWAATRFPSYIGQDELGLSFPATGIGSGSFRFNIPANGADVSKNLYLVTSIATNRWLQLSTRCMVPEFLPAAIAFPPAGGSRSVAVSLPRDCPRTLLADQPWLSAFADLSGTGSFLATIQALSNPGPARATTVRSADSRLSVLQESQSGCELLIQDSVRRIGPSGATLSIPFQLQGTNCAWSAASTARWATIADGASGSGPIGTVQMLIPPFQDQDVRVAEVLINGVAVRIEQLGFDSTLPANLRAISDAATFSSSELSEGGLASVFGLNLAHTVAQAETLPLPTTLGGIRLMLRPPGGTEVPAPLIYVSPTQINFQFPDGAIGAIDVRVESPGRGSNTYGAMVQPFAPRLFEVRNGASTVTAAGYAQLVYPDGTQKITPLDDCVSSDFCQARRIDRGSEGSELYIVLFGTGFPADAALSEYSGPASQPAFTVQFAGRHKDFVGLQQINIHIPRAVFIAGRADFDVTVRGKKTQTLPVRFVSP